MVEKETVEKESKVKNNETYALKEVITKTEIAIVDANTDTVLNNQSVLLEILNKLDRIERAVA